MTRIRLLLVSAVAAVLLVLSGSPIIALAAEEPVTISARFYPAPGREAEAEAFLLKVVAFVRGTEPNSTFRLHRSLKEPTVFFFYEVYPTQGAREAHAKGTLPAFGKQFGPPPEGLFARPPEIEAFRELSN
jgi:quinol monooxygenase YgiN